LSTSVVYRYIIQPTTQFYPRDVVTTTAGHIIVSDYNTHSIHVLSGQGDILTCKVIEDNGIEYPWTLNYPTTTTLPVLPDVMSTRTMSLLLFVVIRGGTVNSLCLLLSY
jgi:hypothetical protein